VTTLPWAEEFEQILRSHCRFAAPDAALDPDASFDALGVDSFGLLGLIVESEEALQVEFPEHMLTGEVLATPAALWRAIGQLLPAADNASGTR
jgi:acyl carrier protein